MSFGYPLIDQIVTSELQLLKPSAVVVDLGTSQRFAKELASFKDLLADKEFYAMGFMPDLNLGVNTCDWGGDIIHLPLQSGSLDLVLCIEVIEHVLDPFQALAEIHRVLKPGGRVILTTPFLIPYHGKGDNYADFSHGAYPDFWRYTHQGLQVLFKEFASVRVNPFTNTYQYYANRVLRMDTLPLFKSQPFQQWLAGLQKPYLGCATHRHLVVARK